MSWTETTGVRVVGLTGGIASGKSSVARIFEEFGLPVVDADQIARELSAPGGKAHDELLRRFGTTDRQKLREEVFRDAQARSDLEAILHPLIRAESAARIQEAALRSRFRPPLVAYEAALLVETGRYRELNGLIVVDAPREVRKRRLIDRDGHSSELADAILSAQTSDQERLRAATHVIVNSGDLDELRRRTEEIIQRLDKELSAS